MTAETTQKKVVSRNVVLVLGLICIILSAGLVAVFALYLPSANSAGRLESDIKAKDNLIASQNATISSQSATISSLSRQVLALQNSSQSSIKDEQIAQLNAYISDLLNVLYLNASTTLLQNQLVQLNASDSISIWSDSLTYAGFITVEVQSGSNTTFAQVVYSSFGVNYNETIVVGTNGAASFPVLPATIVDLRLGNSETSGAFNSTVTATYHF